jgi:hypothetical protein
MRAFRLLLVTNDPVLIAYAVKRAGPSKSGASWTRIGRAYPHETAAGLTDYVLSCAGAFKCKKFRLDEYFWE